MSDFTKYADAMPLHIRREFNNMTSDEKCQFLKDMGVELPGQIVSDAIALVMDKNNKSQIDLGGKKL